MGTLARLCDGSLKLSGKTAQATSFFEDRSRKSAQATGFLAKTTASIAADRAIL